MSMTWFFAVLTVLLCLVAAAVIFVIIEYNFSMLESSLYLLIVGIVIAVLGSIPLTHFAFGEPLYNTKTIGTQSALFFLGLMSIFMVNKKREETLDELEEENGEVESHRISMNEFKSTWKGEW